MEWALQGPETRPAATAALVSFCCSNCKHHSNVVTADGGAGVLELVQSGPGVARWRRSDRACRGDVPLIVPGRLGAVAAE